MCVVGGQGEGVTTKGEPRGALGGSVACGGRYMNLIHVLKFSELSTTRRKEKPFCITLKIKLHSWPTFYAFETVLV